MPLIIGTLFEDFVSNTEGSVFRWISTNSNLKKPLSIQNSQFLRCSTTSYSACIHGIGISLDLEEVKFDLCHCGDHGTRLGGNAFHVEDSNLTMSCIEAIRTWIDTNSGDSTFQTLRGNGTAHLVNETDCSDNGMGAMFDLRDLFERFSAVLINLERTFHNCPITVTNYAGTGLATIEKANILNNTFGVSFFYRDSATLRYSNCFFFGNNKYNSYGNVEVVDCFGDFQRKGVTKVNETMTVVLGMEMKCSKRRTKMFTEAKNVGRIKFVFVLINSQN